jgi:hypothetical protein
MKTIRLDLINYVYKHKPNKYQLKTAFNIDYTTIDRQFRNIRKLDFLELTEKKGYYEIQYKDDIK